MTWGLQAIRVEGAWEHTKGSGTQVLVMDTGLDMEHPEFANNFVKGKNFSDEEPAEVNPSSLITMAMALIRRVRCWVPLWEWLQRPSFLWLKFAVELDIVLPRGC